MFEEREREAIVKMGASPEKLRIDMREKGRESSCCSSSDLLISETTTRREEEEQSPSSTEDFTHSPVSSRWSVKHVDGDKKIRPDCAKQPTVSGSSTKCSLLFLTDTFSLKVGSFG